MINGISYINPFAALHVLGVSYSTKLTKLFTSDLHSPEIDLLINQFVKIAPFFTTMSTEGLPFLVCVLYHVCSNCVINRTINLKLANLGA